MNKKNISKKRKEIGEEINKISDKLARGSNDPQIRKEVASQKLIPIFEDYKYQVEHDFRQVRKEGRENQERLRDQKIFFGNGILLGIAGSYVSSYFLTKDVPILQEIALLLCVIGIVGSLIYLSHEIFKHQQELELFYRDVKKDFGVDVPEGIAKLAQWKFTQQRLLKRKKEELNNLKK